MNTRVTLLLRVVTAVLIVAILIVGGLMGRFLLMGSDADAPRSELERAVVAAEAAVKADPESAPARVKLAAAYLETGAINAAREQAEIAIRLAPEAPEGYYVLGLVEGRDGDDVAALKQLTKAAQTQGQLAGFYQDVWRATAAVHERSGDTSAAIGAVDEALRLGPENAELLVARGRLFEVDERWADALYDYTIAAQFVPDYEPALEGAERIVRGHPEAVDEMVERFDIEMPESDSEPPAQ